MKKNRIILEGEVPNPANPPSGCHFHPRCAYRTDKCVKEVPQLREVGHNHFTACHYAEELNLRGAENETASGI
ncbi:oligopeptide/dipeptide ABC transporter ATP-binding protein [Paenibacillus ferrarius]|uniref:oligopeptide/dipeptide ABC transporter ATP-binding protein n=1 Tax=Paenibacillus ferrarius TaxID=1469647 RepID=UPI0009A51488